MDATPNGEVLHELEQGQQMARERRPNEYSHVILEQADGAEHLVMEAKPGGPSKRVDIDVKPSIAGLSPPLTPADDTNSPLHAATDFDFDEDRLNATARVFLNVHREEVYQREVEIFKLKGELTQARDALKSLEKAAETIGVNQNVNEQSVHPVSEGLVDKEIKAVNDDVRKEGDSPKEDPPGLCDPTSQSLWLKNLGAELIEDDINMA